MKLLKSIKKPGLIFLLPLLLGLVWLFSPGHSLAAPVQADVNACVKNIKFDDVSHLSCQAGNYTIKLVDRDPTDSHQGTAEAGGIRASGKDYVGSATDYADESTPGSFCQDKQDYATFTGGKFHIGDAGSSMKAYVELYYVDPNDNNGGCKKLSGTVTFDGSRTNDIKNLLGGGDNQAGSLSDLIDKADTMYGQTFTRYQNGSFDPGPNVALFSSGITDLETSCNGSILAVYYDNGSGNTATEYDIGNGGDTLGSKANLKNLPKNTGCGVKQENFGLGNSPPAIGLTSPVTGIVVSQLGQKCDENGDTPDGYQCQCTRAGCFLVPGTSTSSTGPTATGSNDTNSACVNNSHTGLEWMLCPFINSLSEMADTLNTLVQSQLDFNVGAFLTGQVHTAWAIVKDIATSMLVIIMLIMVISQAISAGPFDAYTIRKVLPKLVVAVIFMQISWQLCIYAIQIASDAGHGIAGIITAPFGGQSNLELPGVLHHLSAGWAGGVSALTVAGFLLAVTTFAILLLPGVALIAFTVGMAALVALLSVLARNMLIIGLVIFSPLGFLAWTLTNTQTYWKMWKDNFYKLLLLFPLMMGLIYLGRDFAYIAGGVGKPGPLDLIMVLVGFFGPYFYLPKAFKWGGTLMSQAANTIATNKAIAGIRGKGMKELGLKEGWLGRRVNQAAKDYNPADRNFRLERDANGRLVRRLGVLPIAGGNFFNSMKAGRFLPTKRSGAVMMQRGDEHNSKEEAIALAKINRESDKARSQGTVSFGLEKQEDGTYKVVAKEARGTQAGKSVLFRYAGSSDLREAGMADDRALRTSSWVEMGSELVPITDTNLKAQIKASGAEVFENLDINSLNTVMDSLGIKDKKDRDRWVKDYGGAAFVRMYDTPRYNAKVNSSEELYPLPLNKFTVATPHITDPAIRPGEDKTRLSDRYSKVYNEDVPHHIARAIETFQGGYIDEGNIANQSEAELKEFARLSEQPTGYHIADEFGALLARMADGSPGGLNTLSALASNVSLTDTIDRLLGNSKNAEFKNLKQYVQAARVAVNQAPDLTPVATATATNDGSQPSGQSNSGGGGNGGGNNDHSESRTGPADSTRVRREENSDFLEGTVGRDGVHQMSFGDEDLGKFKRAVAEGVAQGMGRVDFRPNDVGARPVEIKLHTDVPGVGLEGNRVDLPGRPANQRPNAEPTSPAPDDWSAPINHEE